MATRDRVAGLERRVAMMADNDEKICRDVNRFSELPMPAEPEYQHVLQILATGTPEEVRQLGFKDKKALRRALWGQRPKKDVPFAIQAAHERQGMRIRKENKAQGGQVFNLNMINIPAPKPAGPEERVVIIHPEPK